MEEIFKLRVTIGEANIELEGDGALVHTIFSELRSEGLGKLVVPALAQRQTGLSKEIKSINPITEDQKDAELNNQGSTDISVLLQINTIVIKDLPKTEAEWILVYALYASEQGEKAFTEEDLRQMYLESGRWNESRRKNFATNVKKAVNVDWFSIINNSNYSLIEAGKNFAYEIIQRASTGNNYKKSKKASNVAKATYDIVDLALNEQQRLEFREYLLSFSSVNNMDKAVLIAYKLSKLGVAEFDENTIFTALRMADMSTSYDLKSSLTNGKSKKNFFILGDTAGMYKLYHFGEDHAKKLEKARGAE